MLFRLFYVSDCTVPPHLVSATIDDIVAVSSRRNRDLSLAGSLLFSGSQFAQYFEGPEENVRLVMASILGDRRHRNIRILLEGDVARARFSSWSLAYSGSAMFVQEKLRTLLCASSPDALEAAIDDVVAMMFRFASES